MSLSVVANLDSGELDLDVIRDKAFELMVTQSWLVHLRGLLHRDHFSYGVPRFLGDFCYIDVTLCAGFSHLVEPRFNRVFTLRIGVGDI